MNRILIRSKVTPYIKDIRGGAGALMMNVGKALSEIGWEVHFISPHPRNSKYQSPNFNNIHFHEFDYSNPTTIVERLFGSVRGRQKLMSVIEKNDIDILIDDVSELPFYPAHIGASFDVTTAIFIHVAPFNDARPTSGLVKGTGLELINRSLGLFDDPKFICASEGTETRIRTYLNTNNTWVLNPCVDTSKYSFNFNQHSNKILYLGRITKRKNVECLVRGWGRIHHSFSDYELIIAGDGPKREEMINLAKDLGISNVQFPGFVSEKEKVRLFETSLLTVIPSFREGYVTTGIEALAAGTPVIGSNTRGINDYIIHGENGLLFETNNPKDLAAKLSNALASPEELRTLANAGRKTANSHNFDEFKKKTDTVIRDVYESQN